MNLLPRPAYASAIKYSNNDDDNLFEETNETGNTSTRNQYEYNLETRFIFQETYQTRVHQSDENRFVDTNRIEFSYT